MDYKELLKIVSSLPDKNLRELNESVKEIMRTNKGETSYAEAKAQIEKFGTLSPESHLK